MTLRNGSASGSLRTHECPAHLAFPRTHESDEYSERGHGLHAYVHDVLAGADSKAALAAIEDDDDRATCERLDWRALVGDLVDVELETAFAVDVKARRARRLGANLRRGYEAACKRLGRALGPWEVPGSLDVSGRRRRDGRRVVRDLKTGFRPVPAAKSNRQGLFFGAAFHLLEDAAEVDFEICKLKPDGSIVVGRSGRASYTALDVERYLDEYGVDLARAKAARRVVLSGGTPDVHVGEWCDYCGAIDHCPAKTALARNLIGELGTVEAQMLGMTSAQRARAWELLTWQIGPIYERVGKALRQAVAAAPEPTILSNGKQVRAISFETERVSASKLAELARALGASDEQIDACSATRVVTQYRETRPQ